MSTPRCPKCGRPSRTPHGDHAREFYCHSCRMSFEDADDGDIGYGRPEKRIERSERTNRPQARR